MMSMEYVRVGCEEGLKKEGSDFDPIDRDELAKIDKTASAKKVSRELASLYAEGMAKGVDEELKSLKEAKEGLTADKRTKEYDEVFKELLESVQMGTTETMLKEAVVKTTKENYAKLVVDAVNWAANSPAFYTGMRLIVSKAAREIGREDIDPCRMDTKDVEDATVYFSKLVLKYGIAHGVMPTKFDERSMRRAVRNVKVQADAVACVGYG